MSKEKILESWEVNADEWINAIKTNAIGSRAVTDPAIVQVIENNSPTKILDAGCGEGWLARSLAKSGIEVVGIDGTKGLIEEARSKSDIPFYTQSFEELIQGDPVGEAPFEAVVFNFCLYLKDEVPQLLKRMRNILNGRRQVFIQTLHPMAFAGNNFHYENQWINDSWKGLKGSFTSPHRWYFRTLNGWMKAFELAGLRLITIDEPLLPEKTKPASIIFTLTFND